MVSPADYAATDGQLPEIQYSPCSIDHDGVFYVHIVRCSCHDAFVMLHVIVEVCHPVSFFYDQRSLSEKCY